MSSWMLWALVFGCLCQYTRSKAVAGDTTKPFLQLRQRLRRLVREDHVCNVSRTSGAIILPDNRKQIMVGLLLPFTMSSPEGEYSSGGAKFYAEAFNYAVEKINNNHTLLPGYRIDYIFNNTHCNEIDSIRAMQYQFMSQVNRGSSVHAFVGLGCGCRGPVKLASALNIPVISHMCSSHELSDQETYPTFSSTNPLLNFVTPSIKALLKEFKWRNVAFIYSNDSVKYKDASADVISGLGELISWRRGFKTAGNNPKGVFLEMLKEVKMKSRVVILLMEYAVAREGLMYASRLGLNSGEYTFVVIEEDWLSLKSRLELPFKWFISRFTVERETVHQDEVKAMFPYTIVLAAKLENPRYQEEYANYVEILKNRSNGPPFCSQFYTGVYRRLKMPLKNIYLYDAVHVLALAINDTLNRGKKISDGLEVMASLRKISYRSVDGSIRKIGNDQNYKDYFRLFTYDYDTKGRKIFTEAAYFNEHGQLVRRRPLAFPRHAPLCGFSGKLCQPSPDIDQSCRVLRDLVVSLFTILLVLACLFVCTFIYRKRASSVRIGWVSWKSGSKNPLSLMGRGP